MAAKRKPQVGDIVEVHFDDHSENVGAVTSIRILR